MDIRAFAIAGMATALFPAFAGQAGSWSLTDDGGIVRLLPEETSDHFEMSSRGVDAIVEWSVTAEGAWKRRGQIRFPTLREAKNLAGTGPAKGPFFKVFALPSPCLIGVSGCGQGREGAGCGQRGGRRGGRLRSGRAAGPPRSGA